MTAQVLEGTWEEIERRAKSLAGRKVRVYVYDEAEPSRPNQAALEVLRKVRDRQKDQEPTNGETSVDIIRSAREGEMFE
jgi:precorrin-3B methylase